MRNIHKYTAALLSTVMILSLLLTGCSGRKDDGTVTITNVSYDPTREFYEKYNKIFESYYESEHSKKINVIQSHGGSGAQARSVVEGCNADVVTLALEHDIDLIQNTGLIDKGWIDEFSDSSAPYTSTIVLLVRKGNPKHISDWDDLVKKNVDVITSFMKKLYENVTIMDSGARGSTTTFVENGQGDVLIAWENEALTTMDSYPGKYEIVNPSVSILAQPSVAIVDDNAKSNGTQEVSKEYLQYLYSDEAQQLIGESGYRPTNQDILNRFSDKFDLNIRLWSIEDYGGWNEAYKTYFDDGAMFDEIYGN